MQETEPCERETGHPMQEAGPREHEIAHPTQETEPPIQEGTALAAGTDRLGREDDPLGEEIPSPTSENESPASENRSLESATPFRGGWRGLDITVSRGFVVSSAHGSC